MNHERVSEIFFEENYCVSRHETARSLFSRISPGRSCAPSLIDCMATAYLMAVAESVCIREMRRHIDDTAEVLVGHTVCMKHCAPIPPGTCLRLCGWVEVIGDRSATFCVRVRDDREVVGEVTITLVAVQRASIESRIAAKIDTLLSAKDSAHAPSTDGAHAESGSN